MLRRLVPHAARQTIRRIRHARAIRNGHFTDSDPLFDRLHEWVGDGDTVLDVGAAVGTYTVRLAELVGPCGRVIALEPLNAQFDLLVSNAGRLPNVTCMQVAASHRLAVAHMSVPNWHGAPNYYEAHISDDGIPVLCAPLDSLPIPRPVRFIKIDAEGHDFAVLKGAEQIITEDGPTIFIEAHDAAITAWLHARGYDGPITAGGANGLYHHSVPLT